MPLKFNFQNSYLLLPEMFYSTVKGGGLANPKLLWWNYALAEELDLGNGSAHELEQIFSGNHLPENSASIAQAYAGHQFGHFTLLGDGRAILIGEHLNQKGNRFDLQLKGAGRTPYSRNGDGRATLYSMLRECIISEAMFKLKIPTSRSLALIASGEEVIREQIQPGAVLTRVAKSHLRVGTFEMARRFGSIDDLKQLADYAIERHYSHLLELKEEEKYLGFFKAVVQTQIKTIVEWMRVGFIHGVMNTDNMSISGETFDYGPCAFLNFYDPQKKYSSIDRNGRYAFGNQPVIAQWNLARFAESLIPILHKEPEQALKYAQEAIDEFPSEYEKAYEAMLRKKLGLNSQENSDLPQILLELMQKNNLDYTNTFLYLEWLIGGGKGEPDEKFIVLEPWVGKWKKELGNQSREDTLNEMRSSNPVFIPRNNEVEKVLQKKVVSTGLIEELEHYLAYFKKPYLRTAVNIEEFPAEYPEDENYQTFCGT